MPDYTIVRWDENNLLTTSPYVNAALRLKRYAFAADYMRLYALYTEGGIYLDTDVEVVKPFDGLLNDQLFMGYQAPGSIAVGVIGSVKGHPFLNRIMAALDADADGKHISFEPLPDLVTRLAKAANDSSLVFYPEHYFYPYNPYSSVAVRQKPLLSNMSHETVCVHHWEGTWLGEASLRNLLGMKLKKIVKDAQARLPVWASRRSFTATR